MGIITQSYKNVQVVQSFSSTDMVTQWKNSHFIFTEKLDFYMVDDLSIAVYALPLWMWTYFSRWDIAN